MRSPKLFMSMIALALSGIAHAGVIDLTSMIGGANVYAIHDFSAQASSVQGAIVAGGNVSLKNYSVNPNNAAAYGKYGVVAGGNYSQTEAEIKQGAVYAGGTMTVASSKVPSTLSTNPLDFAVTEKYYKDLSRDIAGLGATGTAELKWGGVYLSGSGQGGVDVFNVAANLFNGPNYWGFDKLVANQTLIFNVAGSVANFNNGNFGFQSLSGYNVLFNFYEATNVNLKSVIGSVLAPYATVNASAGDVTGTVIVDQWNSSTAIKTGHGFKAVDVAGFNLAAAGPANPGAALGGGSQDLPEPGSLALLLAGLGAAAFAYRRRA